MQFFPSFCSFCLKTGSFCCKKLHFYFKRISASMSDFVTISKIIFIFNVF